ncbi:portal protein [Vibrio phage R01]|nr:portal protein [Vibrio phage R01]
MAKEAKQEEVKTIPAKEIEYKHPTYHTKIKRWQKNRLVCAGTDRVKEAGETLLPKLEGQSSSEYEAMVVRANFFPGALRALHGTNGMIHAKNPTINFPESKLHHLTNIGLSGSSIAEVAEEITEEQMLQGWVGIFAFYTHTEGVGELKPFLSVIQAESIWDWRFALVNGVKQLTYVKFVELVASDNSNMFYTEMVQQVTQLWLDKDGKLNHRICQKVKKGEGGESHWIQKQGGAVLVRGKQVEGVPFRLIGARKMSGKPEEAPIEPIVDVNISHYITSADLEQGRHFTALPTPYICSAAVDADKEFRIGGYNCWVIPEADAKVGMLEYTGQGLLSLEKADTEKKWEMAVLGARMLQNDKKANESKDTVRLRQTGENSIVTNVARQCSTALTYLIREFIAPWTLVSSTEKVGFVLTTDFLTIEISTDMLNSMAALVATDKMSMETFFYNLQRGGIYEAGTTIEKELERIEKMREKDPALTKRKGDVVDLDEDEVENDHVDNRDKSADKGYGKGEE